MYHFGNEKYDIYFGIGGLYPKTYKFTVTEIRAGKYGKEWKEIFDSKQYVAVNAYDYLYCCKRCGYWENAKCMDLYEVNNPDRMKKTKYSYVMYDELKKDWKLIKAYKHNCIHCKEPMLCIQDYEDELTIEMKCEKCGAVLEKGFAFMWD